MVMQAGHRRQLLPPLQHDAGAQCWPATLPSLPPPAAGASSGVCVAVRSPAATTPCCFFSCFFSCFFCFFLSFSSCSCAGVCGTAGWSPAPPAVPAATWPSAYHVVGCHEEPHRCWCEQVTDGSSCRHSNMTPAHTLGPRHTASCHHLQRGARRGSVLQCAAQPPRHPCHLQSRTL